VRQVARHQAGLLLLLHVRLGAVGDLAELRRHVEQVDHAHYPQLHRHRVQLLRRAARRHLLVPHVVACVRHPRGVRAEGGLERLLACEEARLDLLRRREQHVARVAVRHEHRVRLHEHARQELVHLDHADALLEARLQVVDRVAVRREDRALGQPDRLGRVLHQDAQRVELPCRA